MDWLTKTSRNPETPMTIPTVENTHEASSMQRLVRGFVRRIFRWVDVAIRERDQLAQYARELESLRRRRARAAHLAAQAEKAAANIRKRGRSGYMDLESRSYKRWRKCRDNSEDAIRRWREAGNAASEELARKLESAKASNAEVSDRRAHAPENKTGANGGSLY